MEQNRSRIVTKIAYISHVMVYYGFAHEWAELYRQLWKESREEWDKNRNVIAKVIMNNKRMRCKMEFKSGFSKHHSEFLLKDWTYYYYSLGILIDNNSNLIAMIYFIENISWYIHDQFYSVLINYGKRMHEKLNEFLDLYCFIK